jgi:alpha/beta superfamily hydrolase
MPVLDNDAKARDYQPLMKEVPARIDAGIRQMAKEGAKKVIIIAHSMGAQMANYYLAHKKTYREAQTDTPIVAYISIGMGAGNTKFLKKIKLPMLDLYGTDDLPAVKDSAPMRATASSHNKNYKQKVVKGANHFFEGKDDKLVEVVKEALLSFVK